MKMRVKVECIVDEDTVFDAVAECMMQIRTVASEVPRGSKWPCSPYVFATEEVQVIVEKV